MARENLRVEKINGYSVVVAENPDGSIDAQITDGFAKSQGFKNLQDMIERSIGLRCIRDVYGSIPTWVSIKQPFGAEDCLMGHNIMI